MGFREGDQTVLPLSLSSLLFPSHFLEFLMINQEQKITKLFLHLSHMEHNKQQKYCVEFGETLNVKTQKTMETWNLKLTRSGKLGLTGRLLWVAEEGVDTRGEGAGFVGASLKLRRGGFIDASQELPEGGFADASLELLWNLNPIPISTNNRQIETARNRAFEKEIKPYSYWIG